MNSLTILPGLRMLLLFSVSIFISETAIAQDNSWKHKKSEDGIEVYYRKVENSKINELKIETTVNSSLVSLVALLRDVPAYTEWVMNCKMAERIESDTGERLYYSQIDFPWPLSDRDYVAKNQLSQDSVTKTVYSKLSVVPGYVPEKKGIVRIETLEITWKITPISPEKVKIDYHLISDPGGSLPSWMINMAIDKGPVSSLKKLKEMVKRKKYQKASIPNIKNLENAPRYFSSQKD
jgi:ribosome-associated toxin RatA of RatAB toxin-antitoxin module